MRGDTFEALSTLIVETCVACGTAFAMERTFERERRRRRDTFYCPAGHGQHYIDPNIETRLRERAERAEARIVQAHVERKHPQAIT